jgi:hypothetical protein
MARYYIIARQGYGKYILHTDNHMYLGYCYTGSIAPYSYKRKINALKKLVKIAPRYKNLVLEIEEDTPKIGC